jgi:tetratricopeptide (TPR) repeat protein
MKILSIIIVFILTFNFTLFAQKELENIVREGIELHDSGKFAEAISKYEEAAKIDPQSTLVNYEIANTYMAMKEYKKAVKYAEKVIELKKRNLDEAYLLKGNALDMMGKTKESIKSYKEGLKVSPKSYLIHFNLGITYLKDKQTKEAEKCFLEAIHLKPSHASSHLQLGNIGAQVGSKAKGLFGYYFYQLLNPENRFSDFAYKSINDLMPLKTKTQKSENGNNIFELVLPNDLELSTLDLTLSMIPMIDNLLQDSVNTKIVGAKTQEDSASVKEIFKKITPDNPLDAMVFRNIKFFESAAELVDEKEKNQSAWIRFYAQFFADLHKAGHTEAFSYFIAKPSKEPAITKWLHKNADKVKNLNDWLNEYPFSNN